MTQYLSTSHTEALLTSSTRSLYMLQQRDLLATETPVYENLYSPFQHLQQRMSDKCSGGDIIRPRGFWLYRFVCCFHKIK